VNCKKRIHSTVNARVVGSNPTCTVCTVCTVDQGENIKIFFFCFYHFVKFFLKKLDIEKKT